MEIAKPMINEQAAKMAELLPFKGKIGNQTPFILIQLGGKLYLRSCSGGSHSQAMDEWREELKSSGIQESWTTLETGWISLKADGFEILSGSGTIDPPELQYARRTTLFLSLHNLNLEQVRSENWTSE